MPKEARRKLSDVPKENSFIMHFGTELRNLEDLYHVLCQIGDESFRKHVDENKNDFSNWIRYSVMDIELADRIEMTKDKEETKAIIKSRIAYLKSKIREARNSYYEVPDDSRLSDDLRRDLRDREKHFVSGIYSKKEMNDFAKIFPDLMDSNKIRKPIHHHNLNHHHQIKDQNIVEEQPLASQGSEQTKSTEQSKSNNHIHYAQHTQHKKDAVAQNDYQLPPPNVNVGYMDNTTIRENHERIEQIEKENKAIKKYVFETVRDVMIGLFVGVIIGYLIALATMGAL